MYGWRFNVYAFQDNQSSLDIGGASFGKKSIFRYVY